MRWFFNTHIHLHLYHATKWNYFGIRTIAFGKTIQKELQEGLFYELNSLFKKHQISFSNLADVLEKLDNKIPLILLLDQITDIRNFGAATKNSRMYRCRCIVIPS